MNDALAVVINPQVDLLELNCARKQLAKTDPQQRKAPELRYFGGLSIEETAEVPGLSPAAVKREWSTARLWLTRRGKG